ncbi:MAG: hypothetical protein COA79_09700 [Planctomycetota bacterium]|nr:MAG: hypothetical protein COA79_09700 [Planctomycetota bacterium]
MKIRILVILISLLCFMTASSQEIKIGNITTIQGEHINGLVGVGLLVGLNGTGDPDNAEKIRAELALLKNNGFENITERDITSKNVAIVQIIGELNPYAKIGQKISVSIASKGSAKSLKGGKLIHTLLTHPYLGKDKVYAIASGSITVDTDNPNTGTVHAIVEAEVPVTYLIKKDKAQYFLLDLLVPNFSNANQIANDINLLHSSNSEDEEDDEKDKFFIAIAKDAATIRVNIPPKYISNPISFIAEVQKIPITDYIEEAKIVISESKSTVIVSGAVTMASVAIAYKDLSVKIGPQGGQVGREDSFVEIQASSTLKELTNSLNQLGVKSKDLVHIIEMLHSAGNIRAKLVFR